MRAWINNSSAALIGLRKRSIVSVYPLLPGEGKALFAMTEHHHQLELRKVQHLPDGRVSLIYAID
jgi:hypothetical protein